MCFKKSMIKAMKILDLSRKFSSMSVNEMAMKTCKHLIESLRDE